MNYRIYGPDGFLMYLFLWDSELPALRAGLDCHVDERFQTITVL